MSPLCNLLSDLVAIPSLSGEEAQAADFVQAWLTQHKIDSVRLGHTVVAEVQRGCAASTLLLNSHLDTVAAGEGWHGDPWQSSWQDSRLTALGANDAKASVAAMMTATAQLAQRTDWQGRLRLSLHAEEETSNRGMTELLQHFEAPDASITGEPTGLQVVRSQAGLAVLELTWRGQACHAAHVARVEHENALLLAARELAALPDYLQPGDAHPLLGPSSLVVTSLHSGKAHNKVPDLAHAVADARLVPPTTAQDCIELLQSDLPHAEIRVRSERLGPIDTAETETLVQAALIAAGRDSAVGSTTLSDMALLPPGVPAIKVGPGETARSHTANEFVTCDELEAGTHFYEACAHAWFAAQCAEKQPIAT